MSQNGDCLSSYRTKKCSGTEFSLISASCETVSDRISIPTRDLPQAVLVYCWRLAGDWARGTPGRRVHGVGKQASSGSGFHREDG
jgi:hypothetical protein